jgi:hypothetical protein
MICDFAIIKDGLPLLYKCYNDASNSRTIFAEEDNLIMISGFFSALNSFSDSFEDLGTISELKLSNNKLKVSFLKDLNIPNLIYLATHDENSTGLQVQQILKDISQNFLQHYRVNKILEWRGKKDSFYAFEEIIEKFIKEEESKSNEKETNENVNDLLSSLGIKLDDSINPEPIIIEEEEEPNENNPEYYNFIPVFTISKKINPKFYLTGEISHKIYYQIDGKKSIKQIAELLGLKPEKVYNTSKNLIKLGFVSISY